MVNILNQTGNAVVNYENMEAILYHHFKNKQREDWGIRTVTPQDEVYTLGEYKTEEDCKFVFEWLIKEICHKRALIEMPATKESLQTGFSNSDKL